MEKVPQLDIFKRGNIQRSNSAIRLTNSKSSQRPPSNQPMNYSIHHENYYTQASKILNYQSPKNLNQTMGYAFGVNIKNSQLKKGGKYTYSNEQSYPRTHHMNATNIAFQYQTAKQIDTKYLHPQIGTQTGSQNCMPMYQSQKVNLPRKLTNRHGNTQLDRVISITNSWSCIPHSNGLKPINEEDQSLTKSLLKRKPFLLENKDKNLSSSNKINSYLQDATYRLDLKQYQSKLPQLTNIIDGRKEREEKQNIKHYIEELIEMKEQNTLLGEKCVQSLNYLLSKYESSNDKKAQKGFDGDISLRSSRKSLFLKVRDP